MNYKVIMLLAIVVLASCSTKTVKIENVNKGKLHASKKLEIIQTKEILLDSNTAPAPQYIQMFNDTVSGVNYFTFLNTYTNSIYFYDYRTLEFKKKIVYDTQGPNGILKPIGYHIKNLDSIYIYNMTLIELVLANYKGEVLSKKSLIGNQDARSAPWTFKYPQYYTSPATPFLKIKDKLLLPGQYMFSVPDSIVDKFKLTTYIDYDMAKDLSYHHGYPQELYGNGYVWDDPIFTVAYPELSADGKKLVFSFPVSHDLYIADLNGGAYQKVYGGSNQAGTISSNSKKLNQMSGEIILRHIMENDLYAGIKYDIYREVYYRFILKAIPNISDATLWKDKIVGVIILDKDFKYLGETVLGEINEWNWQNSFVTEEGLNIEYLDNNDIEEVALNLRIFTVKDI